MMKPALFLDRDGVINVDHGYVYRRENIEFIDGIFQLVARANAGGYLVVVVTNQAGIGRGYYTEADFFSLMNWMKAEFSARRARIDAVYFCPDHPEHGIGKYRRESIFRKPGPGMLFQAAQELKINLERSILVGDRDTDIEAGHAAGIGTLLRLSPHNHLLDRGMPIVTLFEAVAYLT
jgi:D-glycero-D-manno-heptose 1,7-bisphosphate phosphatase